MTSRTRLALLVFAALGLGASLYGVYVHYRLVTDPAYTSLCDISATVSCQQVFQSEYGSVFGIPVAVGGAIWSALVLALAGWGMRQPRSETAARVAGYVFLIATVGLAAVFYFAYASFFVLKYLCPVCLTMYASVIGTFVVSARSAAPLGSLPSRLGQDLSAIGRSPAAATLAGAWIIGSIALILWFPRDQVVVAAAESEFIQPAGLPTETLTPEQLQEWETWLAAQPRVEGAQATGDAKVVVMKFNDYQCPACRQSWVLYQAILDKYEAQYPGVFRYESRDFPLESECGAGGIHGGACEAAAAVRMARGKNRHKEVEAALYTRQTASMSRDDVKATLQEVAEIDGKTFDSEYPKLLEAIRADAQLGQKLGVSGTPTFFLNGIQLPSVRPAAFDAAIAWALRQAGVTS